MTSDPSIDMLIRAASQFLYITNHQAGPSQDRYTSRSKREVQRLDRLATVLVTKGKVDVSAVAAEVRTDSVNVVNVVGKPQEADHEASLNVLNSTAGVRKDRGSATGESVRSPISLPKISIPAETYDRRWLQNYLKR
jgi:hypothetical protein